MKKYILSKISRIEMVIFFSILVSLISLSVHAEVPTFTEHVITRNANFNFDPEVISIADVNDDGHVDLLVLSGGKVLWYKNNGNTQAPGFTEHVVSAINKDYSSVSSADVDGDGDLDVITSAYNGNEVAWHENDGDNETPQFTKHSFFFRFAGSASSADVDGDGDIDLLASAALGPNNDKVVWFENDGSSNFPIHVIFPFISGARSISSVDVDGDNDIDVLTASIFDDKIVWYENDGAGNFTDHVVSNNADFAFSVDSADVNGDGSIDLLSASRQDDKIAWYENNGAAGFTEHVVSRNANGAAFVSSADLDGDGDIDLLSASEFDNKIAWYENNGSGSFTERLVSSNAIGAKAAISGDIDGDGDIDLISASRGDNKIAWYEQLGSPNANPIITSPNVISINENTTAVSLITTSDDDGDALTYAITGGADQALFTINASGQLSYLTAPVFSNPQDADGNNVYEVEVTVDDGSGGTDSQTLIITVTRSQLVDFNCASLVAAGNTFKCTLNYNTTDSNPNSIGLGFRLHYDSSKLTLGGASNILQTNFLAQDSQPQDDSNDLDGDPNTDKFINTAWVSSNSTWPGGSLPTPLYEVEFTLNENLSVNDDTTLKLSSTGSNNLSYGFSGTPHSVTAAPAFSWDIDGNDVTSFTSDGIIVIRYLFGFRGEQLVSGVVGDNSSRDSAAIEQYLTDNLALLDIDGDGEAKPLTDGLLLIRFLAGFTGETLINGAINAGTRTTPEAVEAYISVFLDSSTIP